MAEKVKADYKPVTAQVRLANTYAAQVNDGKELAEEAGVVNPAHVDYVEALENYESRADVETLAARRAREAGTSFSDADFVRTNDPEGVVTATSVSKEEVDATVDAKHEQAEATADAVGKDNEPSELPKSDDKSKGKK